MLYDALTHLGSLTEIQRELVGAKVQHVMQTRHELLIELHGRARRGALLASVHPVFYRLQVSAGGLDRETTGGHLSGFCALLRKMLRGRTLTAAEPVGLDRIARLRFTGYDEAGGFGQPSLIVEMMGRHSNLVFVDENEIILDSIKHIPSTVNRYREVLPGRPYIPPPGTWLTATPQDLPQRLTVAAEQLGPDADVDDWLRAALPVLSRTTRERLADRHSLQCDAPAATVSIPRREALAEAAVRLFADAPSERRWCVVREDQGRPALLPAALANADENLREPLSSLLTEAGAGATRELRRQTQREQVLAAVRTERKRVEKRLASLRHDLADADTAGVLQRHGELLMAHLHDIPAGVDRIELADWETGTPMLVLLNPDLSPAENAAQLFARAKRLRRRLEQVPPLLQEGERRVARLDGLEARLTTDLDDQTLNAIRTEVVQAGTGASGAKAQPQDRRRAGLPAHQVDGWEVVIGRNAQENQQLLSRVAAPDDWWLHVRGVPGAHGIIRTNGHPERVPAAVIRDAARHLTRFGKARNMSNVPVDYTLVKHVRPAPGRGPGLVTYRRARTLYVSTKQRS